MNRLARERSPYLLQHASNPVEWFPWGDEAFERARTGNRPIFLSSGYSTCHWCHVMAHESFESGDVARVLNEHFVPIKLDREERPDVDRVYMRFVQATTGSGGWPMSVWLTPDLKPFYGGTYFPPAARWGRPGFVEILTEIARVWTADAQKVVQSAERLMAELDRSERAAQTSTMPGGAALERMVEQFRQSFDRRHGGFGGAPKFPRPSELLALFREHARVADADARDMALRTLRAMASGGMRDHIGGGFHRYAVDAEWRVPHFEKMLYDQAQLVLAYIEGAQVSGDPFYLDVADDTLRYVMRQMTDAGGGFYSAEDADSVPPEQASNSHAHKTEGAFYLWRADEVDALLGDAADVVHLRYGLEARGNAPSDPQQEFTGKNLLYLARSIEEIAGRTGRTAPIVERLLKETRVRMFDARLQRPRPYLDDKVLTAWNGLMVAALARMARVHGGFRPASAERDPSYLEAARRAASFIKQHMWQPSSGTLLRRYRDGEAAIEGYAEDYAFLIFGLLELFQADPDPAWLEWAVVLQHRQDALFWDEADGGWFSTTGSDSSVLFRMKEDYDGAEPAASSVSVLNLIVLAHLVDDGQWTERAVRALRLFGERLEQSGRAAPMMAAALSTYLAGIEQIVMVGDGRTSFEHAVAARYRPFAIVLSLSAERQAALASALPFVAPMQPAGGQAAAYVCRDFTCRAPATTVEELDRELSS